MLFFSSQKHQSVNIHVSILMNIIETVTPTTVTDYEYSCTWLVCSQSIFSIIIMIMNRCHFQMRELDLESTSILEAN